ncbi:MAG TPA: pyridoxal 5'-phosphate synthase glutaminase subunit PdxT [Candidatus Dormibacteraeota bacterium]|nr:pyridoxal 5'-phosphate synthase glutaminase subunit PdxT [Candidatus Dormibacteraeota bacterium]
MAPLIGVMALQGAFLEHLRAFEDAGARTRPVRLKEDLAGLDGLVIPGGESTTMTMLMERMGLFDAVRDAVAGGLPALGTCAGMIILASRIDGGIEGQRGFGALRIAVRRNGYGRQLESFEGPVDLAGDPEPFPGVFIRAPILEDAGDTEVIARQDGRPVGVRQGRLMALAFHPELSGDLRLHREFLRLVGGGS